MKIQIFTPAVMSKNICENSACPQEKLRRIFRQTTQRERDLAKMLNNLQAKRKNGNNFLIEYNSREKWAKSEVRACKCGAEKCAA
jgi:uridine kinase